MFGGTAITLTGRYLSSGLERDVFIADQKCNIQRWTTQRAASFSIKHCSLQHICPTVFRSNLESQSQQGSLLFSVLLTELGLCLPSSASHQTQQESGRYLWKSSLTTFTWRPLRCFPTRKTLLWLLCSLTAVSKGGTVTLITWLNSFSHYCLPFPQRAAWQYSLFFTVKQRLQAGDRRSESWLRPQNRNSVHFQKSKCATSSTSKWTFDFIFSFFFFLNSIRIFLFSSLQTVTVVMISNTISLKVCNGSATATHMECWAPAFPEEMPEEKSDTGEIFIHMDGKMNLWSSRFDYHTNFKVIPFENEDNVLLLKPGETEVSLHVCHSLLPIYCTHISVTMHTQHSEWCTCTSLCFNKSFKSALCVEQHNKLSTVSTCMEIIMTIGDVNCNAQVLLNELTCRIPKGLVIPSTGLPVKVRESTSTSGSSAENHFNLNAIIRNQPPAPPRCRCLWTGKFTMWAR